MRWRQRPATARLVMALPAPPAETTPHARSLVPHFVSTIQIHALGPERPTQSGTEPSRLGRRPDANNLPHMSDSTFAAQPHTPQPGGNGEKDGGRSTSDQHPRLSPPPHTQRSHSTDEAVPHKQRISPDFLSSAAREPELHHTSSLHTSSATASEGGCRSRPTSPPP